MIDTQIKDTIGQTSCGNTYGTAFLVADSILLTARHCVLEAIDAGSGITVAFTRHSEKLELAAEILAINEELDACLLSLKEKVDIPALSLSSTLPLAGSGWQSYGFPLQRGSIGYRASGEIVQVLDAPILKMDLDLSVSASVQLASYEGLSGAPVVVDGVCVGVIRVRVDGGVGALSSKALAAFLTANAVSMAVYEQARCFEPNTGAIAVRRQFQASFEKLLSESGGQYVFLEGAHGIGKTTFCQRFQAQSAKFLILGAYSFGQHEGTGPAAVVLAQPEYFFDWLSTSISRAVSGRPPRAQEKSYSHLVGDTDRLLKAFSEHCEKHGSHGILFVDGLNEAHSADRAAVAKLIGLLPRSLPPNLTIVFTAPNSSQLTDVLPGYVRQEKIVQLPRLTHSECESYCAKGLRAERITPTLISTICEKANGHPLYLRYLIEFANESEQQELSEFPTLQGAIEEYYESLWNSLLSDADALSLLGLISRLRWGMPTAELVNVLPPSEHGVFVSTISRIRHLLTAPDWTDIYHASFSEFIRAKTSDLEQAFHEKIGRYCSQNMETRYSISNVVFHLLRSAASMKSQAVELCSQEWIDSCVEIGVNPDTLILDLKDSLSAAILISDSASVFRLLLLQQRVEFRYNTLFANSAFLVAAAMIALKRPQDAIKHAIRFKRPIISLDEGLHLSHLLIEGEHQNEVFDLLEALNLALHEYRFANSDGVSVDEFVMQTRSELLMAIHANWSDGAHRGKLFAGILGHAESQIEGVLSENEEALDLCMSHLRSVPVGAYLYHAGVYTPIDVLKPLGAMLASKTHLILLASALFDYREYVEKFGMRERKVPLGVLFEDFSRLLDEIEPGVKYDEGTLGVLIELGAPSELAMRLSKRVFIDQENESPFLKSNGVDVDLSALNQTLNLWMVRGFLRTGTEVPLPRSFGTEDWIDCLAQLVRAVAVCEGLARRALADADETLSRKTLTALKARVIDQLNFTLRERVNWQNSYAIPESVFAVIYQRVTITLRDCYPEELPLFLCNLKSRMSKQLGLYSEGFRKATTEVLRNSKAADASTRLNDARYEVMLDFRDFVVSGVENRHELVPELLRLIPMYATVGAYEEAEQTYRRVLSMSMGPSWYKEDQFGLLITALRHLPVTGGAMLSLPKVAGLLERASGELTFQRFARHAKSELIAELCRRGLHDLARRYFQRQSCGTADELLQDAALGLADRIDARRGARHPGGAIDEQQSILSFVNNSLAADWRLQFALLQVFLCGDKRHLKDYAAAFANAIKRETDTAQHAAMRDRLSFIIATDLAQSERSEFRAEVDRILGDTARNESKGEVLQVQQTEPEHASEPRDELFMPGVFGRRTATHSAQAKLEIAEGHVKRRNFGAAREAAVATLREFQDGDWRVWGNLSASATRAEEILHMGNAGEADLVKGYGVLIENERHSEKWHIADHLLKKMGKALSTANAASFWNHTLQHISLMAGDSEHETGLFEFLSDEYEQDAEVALFGLLMWTLDHPQWLRRERAACATLWLMEEKNDFFALAAQEAFSMTPGYRADIVAGAIETMSRRNPQETWIRLSSSVDVLKATSDCRHIGRLSILLKIATRASGNNENARQAAESIKGAFRPGAVDLDDTGKPPYIPDWAQCARIELRSLDELGALTGETLARTEEILSEICAPQSIQEAWNLENAVSLSFREPNRRTLNRWSGLVRHSLACALFPYASQRDLEQLGAILSIYNPSAPERNLDAEFVPLGERILTAANGSGNLSDLIGNGDYYFLSYHEFFTDATGDASHLVEVFATIILDASDTRRAYAASVNSKFPVTTYPNIGDLGGVAGPTCLRPTPVEALFGRFTPAVPLPSFMSTVGVVGSDILQKTWRHGRSFEVRHIGKPENEGCMLAARKAAVRLPAGSTLVWTVMVDGEPVFVIDNNLNKLD